MSLTRGDSFYVTQGRGEREHVLRVEAHVWGMETRDVRLLHELETENAQLKRIVANQGIRTRCGEWIVGGHV